MPRLAWDSGRVPAPVVGGFYQSVKDFHGGTLDAVPEKEFVRAGEAVDRRHEPQDEAVVAIEGRPGLPRPYLLWSRSTEPRNGKYEPASAIKIVQGAPPPGPPARR